MLATLSWARHAFIYAPQRPWRILLVSDLQCLLGPGESPSLPIVACLVSGGARIRSQADRHQASALDHGRRDYFYTDYERKTKSFLKTCECTERLQVPSHCPDANFLVLEGEIWE